MGRYDATEPILALDCGNRLGESIVWDDRDGLLYWTNIHDREVWAWDPVSDGEPRVLPMPGRVGALGLREAGGLVVAFERSFAVVDPGLTRVQHLADLPDQQGDNRLNDGRVGPGGRFVCGGMNESSPQRSCAGLYSLEPSGHLEQMISDVACSNSLCWSPEGDTMFFTDMPTRRIDAFDYDPVTGAVSNRRPFVQLPDALPSPDGSVVDAEGHLWNAQWEGAKLVRYRPDGQVEREVTIPVSNPTCMAFGGPDLDILFVTSASFLLTEERLSAEPRAGSLFALRPGVRGLRERRFGG